MHRLHTAALAAVLAAALLPSAADAAVNVSVMVGVPVQPSLVVVRPGVRVVEDCDEEVYFASGWYWVRRDGGWYRARRPHAAFVYVEPRVVPVAVMRMPPGQYVRYKHEKHGRGHWKDRDGDEGRGHGGGHGRGHGHDKHRW